MRARAARRHSRARMRSRAAAIARLDGNAIGTRFEFSAYINFHADWFYSFYTALRRNITEHPAGTAHCHGAVPAPGKKGGLRVAGASGSSHKGLDMELVTAFQTVKSARNQLHVPPP